MTSQPESAGINKPPVRVGVAAIVSARGGKVLIGKRKGSHGSGTWQFPGGHLEHGEEPSECALRECFEETGLVVKNARLVTVTNDVFATEEKHYITLFVKCEVDNVDNVGEEPRAMVMEPEKCELWVWKSWNEISEMATMGENIFLPMLNLLKEHERPEDL